jgi:hypothetical protein
MNYYYVASTYGATGEGITVSLLVTRAYPKLARDYKVEPSWDDNGYNPGELKYPQSQVALLEFADIFHPFWAQGAEVMSREKFMTDYDQWIPERIKILTDAANNHPPGNFQWNTHFHINYS